MNIVLMAGGGGTRLWPVSRQSNPKQFFKFNGKETLLEQAYNRAADLTSPDHIFVATLEKYGDRIRELLPKVAPRNIFYEPVRRDTTAAFAAVAIRLSARGLGEEPAVFLWSDHVFTAEKDFLTDIRKIPDLIKKYPDTIIMAGHVPTFPETGLGYIETADLVEGYDDVYRVKSFKEKPKLAVAKKFLAAGNYFWNIGSFSFRPTYFLQELGRWEPTMMPDLDKFGAAVRQGDEKAAAAIYETLAKKSVEYTVMERTPRVIVVTGDYGWSDIGNWATVYEILGLKGEQVGDDEHVHVHVSSKDNFVYNTTKKAVSLIGMKDTIVAVTEDAVLVVNKKDAHLVKEVVQRLEQEGRHSYL